MSILIAQNRSKLFSLQVEKSTKGKKYFLINNVLSKIEI